jgi:hypothetical protein
MTKMKHYTRLSNPLGGYGVVIVFMAQTNPLLSARGF